PSRIARTPEAGEDLAPLREVPVAERRAGHGRVDGPRAAAQHLVLVAEEDLRVLGVRERAEARVGTEVGRRPLPDVADQLLRAGGRRALRTGPHGRGPEPLGVGEVRACTVGRAVAPREAALGAAGPRRCALPLLLGRQPLAGPACERVRLVPGDVLHGL